MLGLFPDFPRGMGNLLRHHPLGLCDSHARKPSALVCLQQSFLLSIVALGQFFSAVMPNPIVATSISLVFTSPSLVLSGYTWPTIALPAFYQKIGQVFPLTHFVIGYRNVALMGCGFPQ